MSILDALYKRDNAICQICSKYVNRNTASKGHITPKSLDGSDKLSNLQLEHIKCNNNKGNGYRQIFFYSTNAQTNPEDKVVWQLNNGKILFTLREQDGEYLLTLSIRE